MNSVMNSLQSIHIDRHVDEKSCQVIVGHWIINEKKGLAVPKSRGLKRFAWYIKVSGEHNTHPFSQLSMFPSHQCLKSIVMIVKEYGFKEIAQTSRNYIVPFQILKMSVSTFVRHCFCYFWPVFEFKKNGRFTGRVEVQILTVSVQ